mmetsp:Transcript_153660/g.286420  ORF Transcript_153660/g.286420 Transcript_153660/m.286420 type:complete len:801 (-) Transcript_153660:182-2584(-)
MDATVKAQLCQNVQRYMLEFLQRFRAPNGDGGYETDFYYVEQAKNMVREDKRTLYVKMSHLEEIEPGILSYDPADLRNVIQMKYLLVRNSINAAVPLLLAKLEDPDLQERVRKARETDELKFVAAFWDLPTYSGLRDLRTDKLGQLVTMCGTVTRTTEMKPELLVGTFKCGNCAREVSGVEQQFKVTYPAICPGRNCGNRTSWELLGDSRTTRWGDWQRIRLQENENEVPAGSMPRSMDVIVRDETCERCKPGDKVMVTGCLIVVPDVPTMMSPSELKQQVRRSLNTRSDNAYGGAEGVRGLKGLGNRDLTYKLSFFGSFIDMDNEWGFRGGGQSESIRSDDRVYLSQSDKERFRQISDHVGAGGRRDCFDVVARSIAPAVCGHHEVKKGILLMLIGGLAKKTDEGIKLRGDINVCILGDPATAKSAMLKWTSQFLPRAVFASGKASTAAGLTASVVRDLDLDNEKLIEPGALMLADNGVCCIDEFELMDPKDQVAIHEAMEQQSISISKAGIVASLQARCAVVAVANPTEGRYDPQRSFAENVNLADPILSRFDVLCVLRDEADPVQDERLADHVLSSHRRAHPEATSDDKQIQPKIQQKTSHIQPIDQELLQKYIVYARQRVFPKIANIDKEKLSNFYKDIRAEAFRQGGAPMTARHIESIIRLAEASARLELRHHVLSKDLDYAISLMLESFIQSQKHQVAGELRKKFRRYIAQSTPISDQFMALLERLFKDKAEQMRLARPGGEAPAIADVSIDMADVVKQIERYDLDMDEAQNFMRTQRFRQNFRVEGETVFQAV